MLVEVILELLIGIVDAELFKTVPLEVLKPEDVKDPNGQALERQRKQVLWWVLPWEHFFGREGPAPG